MVTRLSVQGIPKQTEICQREVFQIPEERCPLSLCLELNVGERSFLVHQCDFMGIVDKARSSGVTPSSQGEMSG